MPHWSLGGKGIAIRCPRHYFNYKGFHSIVTLDLVNRGNKFVWVAVGINGTNSDAVIFNQCQLHGCIVTNQLDILATKPIVPGDSSTLYFFLGNNAFAHKTSYSTITAFIALNLHLKRESRHIIQKSRNP